jgi:pimeloyl-ACP methyl ester carboxylesterase
VLTLTLIATSPADAGSPDRPAPPPMADRAKAFFADPPAEPDWTDRAAVVEHALAGERAFAGTLPPDDERVRALAGRAFDRASDPAAAANHWGIEGGEPVRGRLADLAVPTLVLHGTADPLFPIGHGETLAREIPGARLVPLEGMGHQAPPPPLWDAVLDALVTHTAPRPE